MSPPLREGLRLGAITALLAWVASDLPTVLFVLVTGVLPGLWWSSAAWESEDVDLELANVVAVLAALPVIVFVGLDEAVLVALALWGGAALSRVRLRPARVPTVAGEVWARRNAHRYRTGRADRPFPDMTSADPYAPLYGWRPRPTPPAPLEVPPEHEIHLGRRPS